MAKPDLAAQVADVLDVAAEDYQARVEADAEVILRELDAGTFDNPQGIVGLEVEFYAVAAAEAEGWTDRDATTGSLARLPRRLLEYVGFEKELGLHNAEISTSPQPLNRYGLRAQEAEVCARIEAARAPMHTEGLALVSDGVWTIPPAGETAREYLTDSVEVDGVRIATNMSASARYHAMANTGPARMAIDVPHVHLAADTVMPESLITSIQPHSQGPHARDLPTHLRYALRIAGPLLALAVNSPLFPPDLYDEATPEAILADGWHEHRIPVFETVMNAEGVPDKVRFPHDVETVEEAVDRIVADETIVPMPVSGGDRFDDQFAHFRTKHGTYWRWIRPVFDGSTREAANARIEFRPLPAQPTIRDNVAFQAAFAGLLTGLYRDDHPVRGLPWETAKRNFYAAAREGLDADLVWIDVDGTEMTDTRAICATLLDHAAEGLAASGLGPLEVDRYVEPLRGRLDAGTTPAAWKREGVRRRLDDGEEFADAVHGTQRAYLARQKETLLAGTFVDWL